MSDSRINRLTITRPDDWHLHLRDGAVLRDVLPDTARHFGRAIVMPNLSPPVALTSDAVAYRKRILDALPHGSRFEPLMTLYLTEATTPDEIVRAKDSGIVHGVKLYPANATTNSHAGVADLGRVTSVLDAMQRVDLPLLVHGEVTDPDVDVFDREAVFIERHLDRIVRDFPSLRIVLEHVTTREGTQFVADAPAAVAGTLTVHHLLLNRNAIFAGGLRPHHYCLPVLKRELHRQALVAAAISGSPKFFLGTDSAPHPKHAKESACGCAGIYTAHAAIELYAEAFDSAGALDRLEAFASHYGPDFYRLPRNADRITLVREPMPVASSLSMGGHELVPFRAGEAVGWRVEE